MNDFLSIGNEAYVNLSKVLLITEMDSGKLRRELIKREMDKNSPKFWNTGGAKEIRSVILCDDGMLLASAVNADTLIKRINE